MKTIVFFTALLLFLSLHMTVSAQSTMRNSQYRIQWGNLNSFSGKSTGSDYSLGATGGQIAPGLYSGSNFKVRSGFQYIHSIIPFEFTVSEQSINFGRLAPGEPITRTTNITISNGSANGYQVTAFQKHPLRVLSNGAVIPDTTCDSGTCSETTASEWSSPLTYGFGYRCDNISGSGCHTDFSTSSYYKQFANQESGETPQAVMTGSNVGRDIIGQVTYKANISNTQAAGLYQTIVTYIATPTF